MIELLIALDLTKKLLTNVTLFSLAVFLLAYAAYLRSRT